MPKMGNCASTTGALVVATRHVGCCGHLGRPRHSRYRLGAAAPPSDRLVSLLREVRQLSALGFRIPAKIQAVADTAKTFYRCVAVD